MKKQNLNREQRIALALIVRRHLIRYKDEIRMEHAAWEEQHALAAGEGIFELAEARKSRPGVKASTALAQLIGLPPYPNANKGKPEHAKYLLDFLNSAGPAHVDPAPDRYSIITRVHRYSGPDWTGLQTLRV